ncbi:MAG: hypothetical protein HY290_20290 [Planctomycetia bacterium]|nr:hypothetical protein [Planctomycetia bacterium]
MRRNVCCLALMTGALFAATWLMRQPASQADDKTDSKDKTTAEDKPGVKKKLLRAFMHKKLAASQSVLEGLVVEDFDLVAEGAKQLDVVAKGAEFMVSKDPTYIDHANRFRRVVEKLSKEAKEKRLDGATLTYVDMTIRCVECHKHVRDTPGDR